MLIETATLGHSSSTTLMNEVESPAAPAHGHAHCQGVVWGHWAGADPHLAHVVRRKRAALWVARCQGRGKGLAKLGRPW